MKPTTELAWNVITEVLGNVSPSELPADVRAALDPPKSFAELQPHRPFACFFTWRELQTYVGKAPAGYEWHHIIEQSVVDEYPGVPEINLFIQSTTNIVLIPKIRHLMITAEMNTNTNRLAVHAHPLHLQYEIGEELLREWGAML